MADRWTSVQNIKFLELYKNQTNLWNSLDPNYKNRDLRKASLEHIRMALSLRDTNEVTRKIKNLRSTYNQELLKIEKSKKNANGITKIYKPSIKWFDAMDYIMKTINVKEKETSHQEPHHSSTSGIDLSEDSSQTNNEGLDIGGNSNNAVELQPMKPPKKPRSKMKLSPERFKIQAAVNELKELKNSLTISAPSPKESEDECYIFGGHVVVQLRQLPTIDRIEAMDEIQGILSRYRKKALCDRIVYTPSNYSSECAPSSQPTVVFEKISREIDYE